MNWTFFFHSDMYFDSLNSDLNVVKLSYIYFQAENLLSHCRYLVASLDANILQFQVLESETK